MSVYEVIPDERCEWGNFATKEERRAWVECLGRPLLSRSRPGVEIVKVVSRGKKLRPLDFVWVGHQMFALRPRAVELLADVWRANGELVPIRTDDSSELFVFNCLNVVDGLDVERSTVARMPAGWILAVKNYVFRPEVVGDLDLFRVTELPSSAIFVSTRFCERYRAAGLKGLSFKEIWSDPSATSE